MISLQHFLFIAAILFCLGIYAVITRKNAIQVLIGIELMINASILNLVAFAKYDVINNNGQLFALFVIVLAAASVAVGLVIILNFFKRVKTIDPNKANSLRG
ncbi:NADH-quinone oxidoreductase subunit K [Pedobacter glucosidilyticus]|jgi:NADH-quinone oxidoreductase subunit K|uniref:NADH-quinone oxidoreductase subunit K n=1 Tax=Pedobacter aquae TaxID=2605747 RepID=A0A5C0VHQ7_9SPHI|nr:MULTISPECIES: NADH-quinone oxidoreductase subunit NuoK [Pedobacter]KHJ38537.1 NADH-quinone oxidoreductase subunit K [Pedobacter glucosidilyticus]QEK50554.1 NADH-quinone oxidoreductase subunit NuoK [Pedobacter aquae]